MSEISKWTKEQARQDLIARAKNGYEVIRDGVVKSFELLKVNIQKELLKLMDHEKELRLFAFLQTLLQEMGGVLPKPLDQNIFEDPLKAVEMQISFFKTKIEFIERLQPSLLKMEEEWKELSETCEKMTPQCLGKNLLQKRKNMEVFFIKDFLSDDVNDDAWEQLLRNLIKIHNNREGEQPESKKNIPEKKRCGTGREGNKRHRGRGGSGPSGGSGK